MDARIRVLLAPRASHLPRVQAIIPRPVTQTLTRTISLPAVPRRVTPRANRRSWGEGHVRFWWTSAVAVLLVAAYIAASGIREELKLRRLLRDGVDVTATAYRVKGVTA